MNFIDYSCPYCGAPVMMDKHNRGYCEYCGQWVVYDDKSDKVVLEDAYKAGYEFEKGRQQAQAEARTQSAAYSQSQQQYEQAPAGRRHWFWWVVGWIFIFPIPLMILMIRNKYLNPWVKALIIVAGWAVYFLIAHFGGGSS